MPNPITEGIDPIGIRNTSDTQINPATEDKQDEIIAAIGGGLVSGAYDYIALTYVAAGDGVGEIETATYKTGGAGGTTISTITITYNSLDEIATVTSA